MGNGWCSILCIEPAQSPHERWQLRANEVEHNRLFEGLETEDNDLSEPHDNDVKEAYEFSFASFAPPSKDNQAPPFGVGIVDPTFTGESDGHVNSDGED